MPPRRQSRFRSPVPCSPSRPATAALGLRYDFTRNFGVRADWQRYVDVGGDKTGEMDINVVGAGLLVTF